jgi:hypothetical protein
MCFSRTEINTHERNILYKLDISWIFADPFVKISGPLDRVHKGKDMVLAVLRTKVRRLLLMCGCTKFSVLFVIS